MSLFPASASLGGGASSASAPLTSASAASRGAAAARSWDASLPWQPLALRSGGVPKGRWGHSLTQVQDRFLVIFGGLQGAETLNDVWIYDLEEARWARPHVRGEPPEPRWGHTATLVAPTVLLMLGGRVGTKPIPLADYWLLDLRRLAWSRHATLTPSPKGRYAHAAVWLGARGSPHTLVFGGHGGRSRYYNDANVLQLPSAEAPCEAAWMTPVLSGPPPRKRSGHTMTLIGERAFIIGGYDGVDILSDITILNTRSWTWSAPRLAGSGIPPLVGHSAEAVSDSESQVRAWG